MRRALRAAHRKRFEAALDRAVEEGKLSEEQADRIREHMAEGPPGFGHGFRFRGGPPGGPGGPHGLAAPAGPEGPGHFAIPVPPPR